MPHVVAFLPVGTGEKAAFEAGDDDIPEFAAELRDELQRRYAPKELLVSPITPVIAAHAGIGAWGVFYQVEDGTKR